MEKWRHQCVLVEVAAKVELLPGVPAVPNGFGRQNHLAHSSSGLRPFHRETLSYMGSDLTAQTQSEATLRHQLDIIGAICKVHRVSSETNHDAGAKLNLFGGLSHKGKHRKRVMARLRDPKTVVTDLFLFARFVHNPVKPTVNTYAAIDLHSFELSAAAGMAPQPHRG